ncbi:MAG: STAS domain-containing protein [Ruminococcus sp.]
MEEMFQINGTDLVIKVPRELDHHTAEKMNAGADRIIERKNIRRLIYDFKKTEFMDSSGVGAIMGRYRNICLIGGAVQAVHVNERVNKLFHLSGIDKVIEVQKEKSWNKEGNQKGD